MEGFLYFLAGSLVTWITSRAYARLPIRSMLVCSFEFTDLRTADGGGANHLALTWGTLPLGSPAVGRLTVRNKGLRDVSIADFQGMPLVFKFDQARVLGFVVGPAPEHVVSETSEHAVIIQPSFIRGKRVFHIDFIIDGERRITGYDSPILNVDVAGNF